MRKGFSLTAVIIIVLLVIVIAAGAYWAGTQGLVPINKLTISPPPPSPSAVSPTADPTAEWKTYTNSVQGFSFKYSPDWVIDTASANEKENAQIKLKKVQAVIQIYANMIGIGGVGQDYQGTNIGLGGMNLYKYKFVSSYNSMQIIGITDTLTKSLGLFQYNGKTYSITLTYPSEYNQTQQGSDLEKEFDLMLSTFKFTQ